MKFVITVLMLGTALVACAAGATQDLPSRDPATVIPLLKQLKGRPTVKQIEEIVGAHDRAAGSGRCIFVYVLKEKSELWVNTGDCVHADWITRRRPGQPDEVIFQAVHDPNPRSS